MPSPGLIGRYGVTRDGGILLDLLTTQAGSRFPTVLQLAAGALLSSAMEVTQQ